LLLLVSVYSCNAPNHQKLHELAEQDERLGFLNRFYAELPSEEQWPSHNLESSDYYWAKELEEQISRLTSLYMGSDRKTRVDILDSIGQIAIT
jgi:hypothetical protein